MGFIEGFGVAKSIWSMTFKMAKKRPCIFLPFFIIAFCNAAALAILFYFPRYPLSKIFAQPIRAFRSERFLHYPANFELLPELFYYAQILIMVTVGVVMFGMVVNLVFQLNVGEKPRIAGSFNKSVRRYLTLAGIWIITFIIGLIVMKSTSFLVVKFLPKNAFTLIIFHVLRYTAFLFLFIIETFFVFSYPAAIIEKRKLFSAVKKSFLTAKKVFLPAFILVLAPRILELLFIIARGYLVPYFNRNLPEATLFLLGVGIAVTFIADALVIPAITNLFVLTVETET